MEFDDEDSDSSGNEDQYEDSSTERSVDDDDDDEDDDPDDYYATMLGCLVHVDYYTLELCRRDVIAVVLENIGFCETLSRAKTSTLHIWIGDMRGDDAEGPKLELTDERDTAWKKLFLAFRRIAPSVRVRFGGYNLGWSILSRAAQAMNQARSIALCFPWNSAGGDDMRSFIDTLVLLPNEKLTSVNFNGQTIINGSKQYLSTDNADRKDRFFAPLLLQLSFLKRLDFHEIKFSEDDCDMITDVLSSNSCSVEDVGVFACSFTEESASRMGEALESTATSPKSITFVKSFQEKAFCDSLMACLALNRSMKKLVLSSPGASNAIDVVETIKNPCGENPVSLLSQVPIELTCKRFKTSFNRTTL